MISEKKVKLLNDVAKYAHDSREIQECVASIDSYIDHFLDRFKDTVALLVRSQASSDLHVARKRLEQLVSESESGARDYEWTARNDRDNYKAQSECLQQIVRLMEVIHAD